MIDEFRTFTHVARLGSLSAAGRVLGMTPSSVGRQMDKLEAHFSVQLLNRTTHLVSPTEAGQRLLLEADTLLAQYDEISHGLHAEQASPRGSLRISAMTSFGRKHIAPLLPEFLDRYPDLKVYIDLNNRLVNLVEDNIDVGIRMGVPQDSALRSRLLAPDRAVLVASPAYLQRYGQPGHPDELRHHNCVTIDHFRRLTYWHFRRQEHHLRVGVSGNLQACSGEPTVEAALAGLGISLIAGWMIQDELAKGLLIPLLPDWRASIYEEESAGLYAVFRGDRFQRPAVRAFIDFLVEKLPQRLNGLD